VWKASELATFLRVVEDDRLAGAWWLLATTGMRRGEVLGLRWADIDLDAGRLTIIRTLITTDVQRTGEPGMAWARPRPARAVDKRWTRRPCRPFVPIEAASYRSGWPLVGNRGRSGSRTGDWGPGVAHFAGPP
jgi:integrase